MPQLTVHAITGKTAGKINLPDHLFAAKINRPLMAQAIRVHLANQRQSPAKTKTRGQVSLAKHKIWRQKGTGRARHGSRNAPIFVKGGIAHGPTGQQNYQLKLTRKLRLAALASALTSKHQSHQILVIKGLQALKPKTKLAVQFLTRLKLQNQKVTFILPHPIQNIILATRNLPQVATFPAHTLNTYQVLNAGHLIFLPDSITTLQNTFLKTPAKTSPPAKLTSVKTPTTRSSAKKPATPTQAKKPLTKSTITKKTSSKKSPAPSKKPAGKKTAPKTPHRRSQITKARTTKPKPRKKPVTK